jgi:RNA polymerase sigma-70 factor (ECF subfamily)
MIDSCQQLIRRATECDCSRKCFPKESEATLVVYSSTSLFRHPSLMSDIPPEQVHELLARARAGEAAALEQLFALCREELRQHAERQLDSQLQKRVDASDVLQQTMLDAQQGLPDFQGQVSAEWWGWINRILHNNIVEEVRKHMLAQKRDIGKDRSMDDSRARGGALKLLLSGQLSSPSQKAVKREQREAILQEIEQLPASQREAIRMRYLQEMPLAEIAEVMERSELAVGGLLKRGLRCLRDMQQPSERSDTDGG